MQDIYSYIISEEARFETEKIRLGDNWEWNFRDHVQLIYHLKNGVFYTGGNDFLRAFKNIMEPLLNLAYWTEDIDVKDVVFYIEGEQGRALSFLVKKYHDEVYVREHNLDKLFDEITESDLDYGGVVVDTIKKETPIVLQLNAIAFCDQGDLKSGAIGIKHTFSPEKLRRMKERGWGSEKYGATVSIEDIIVLAKPEKPQGGVIQTKKNHATSKSIEVFIVRGSLPKAYLEDSEEYEIYTDQVHVVAFYTDKKGKKVGVTLYKNKATTDDLKFFTSKEVYGRALGRGVGESLVHPQVWTNFLTIHKMSLLEAAAKVPLVTDDPAYQNRNKIQEMENLEITTIEEGKSIQQVPTAATANIQLYQNAINEWFEHSQLTGAAFDPILGKEATSGTTFRGQERTVAQGRGLHDRRRGQRAKFIESLYREHIIGDIVSEIVDGKKFMATLSADELQWVADQLTTNYINKKKKEAILKMKTISEEEEQILRDSFKKDFLKKGNRHLINILKGEFEGIEVRMGINVAGKQKDLVNLSDKVLSIFQFIFSNPSGFQQAMQIPALAKSFHDILEFGGLNQVDFTSLMSAPQVQLPQQQPQAPQLLPNQAAV